MVELTIGSIFSGIGGLELGLERAGLGPVRWQAEIDPFCRAELATKWPRARQYADVREVGDNAERVGLICGGFPCQDISNAGRRAGIAGARSGLWAEFARVVRTLGPEFVVVENVAALANRGLDRVLGDLAACGYDATWDGLPASAVGAPQRRDRLFVIARRVSDAGGKSGQRQPGRREPGGALPAESRKVGEHAMADAEGEGRQGPRLRGRPAHGRLADADERRLQGERLALPQWPPAPNDVHAWRAVPPSAQPAFCRLADGLPPELDRFRGTARRHALKAYGNAVCVTVAQAIGEAIVQACEPHENGRSVEEPHV